eukprot:m.977628 g.977628  ORF g.977628 m.977628 type:complete len:214 (+) comp23954_c1_seq6:118-759(+)
MSQSRHTCRGHVGIWMLWTVYQIFFFRIFAIAQHDVPCPTAGNDLHATIAIYGGTAGGVVAAVAAARTLRPAKGSNTTILIINPTAHLGGMVSGGLGCTDGGPSGGIAEEFFQKVGGLRFAPSAAERVFDDLVGNETTITVLSTCMVDAAKVVRTGEGPQANHAIASITTVTGGTISADVRTLPGCLFAWPLSQMIVLQLGLVSQELMVGSDL